MHNLEIGQIVSDWCDQIAWLLVRFLWLFRSKWCITGAWSLWWRLISIKRLFLKRIHLDIVVSPAWHLISRIWPLLNCLLCNRSIFSRSNVSNVHHLPFFLLLPQLNLFPLNWFSINLELNDNVAQVNLYLKLNRDCMSLQAKTKCSQWAFSTSNRVLKADCVCMSGLISPLSIYLSLSLCLSTYLPISLRLPPSLTIVFQRRTAR